MLLPEEKSQTVDQEGVVVESKRFREKVMNLGAEIRRRIDSSAGSLANHEDQTIGDWARQEGKPLLSRFLASAREAALSLGRKKAVEVVTEAIGVEEDEEVEVIAETAVEEALAEVQILEDEFVAEVEGGAEPEEIILTGIPFDQKETIPQKTISGRAISTFRAGTTALVLASVIVLGARKEFAGVRQGIKEVIVWTNSQLFRTIYQEVASRFGDKKAISFKEAGKLGMSQETYATYYNHFHLWLEGGKTALTGTDFINWFLATPEDRQLVFGDPSGWSEGVNEYAKIISNVLKDENVNSADLAERLIAGGKDKMESLLLEAFIRSWQEKKPISTYSEDLLAGLGDEARLALKDLNGDEKIDIADALLTWWGKTHPFSYSSKTSYAPHVPLLRFILSDPAGRQILEAGLKASSIRQIREIGQRQQDLMKTLRFQARQQGEKV